MPVRPISTAGRAEPAENEALVTSQGLVAIHKSDLKITEWVQVAGGEVAGGRCWQWQVAGYGSGQ